MARNPILEEIYAVRETLLAEHQGDIRAYVQAARQRALASGRSIATPKQRAQRGARAADTGVAKTEDSLPASR